VASILIVDDEPDVRELFNITLKMAGHTTKTVKDGQEALEMLQEGDAPELIVLDLMMPRLDGFGLLTQIRDSMRERKMRVLIATAKVLEESDKDKLNKWPVVDVLNKGELDIAQMVQIVSKALSQEAETGASLGESNSKPSSSTIIKGSRSSHIRSGPDKSNND